MDSPSKGYSFVFFIGYAIGFAIVRLIGLNVFLGIYLAKIINFLIILFLGYYSIKLIPFGKILLTVYLMIPMMLQQSTAISADSLINSTILLFISYTLNLTFKNDKLSKKEIILFLVMTIFVGISKITYLPLLGIGIILAKNRKELSINQKILLGVLAIAICLASLGILSILTRGYTNVSAKEYLETAGVNSSEQINGIISNPFNYIKVMINDLFVNGKFYLFSMIGSYMGWLSIEASGVFVISYIALLIASIFIEHNEVSLKIGERIWMLFLAILMVLLVITGLYIEWTGVGASTVAGVQGRYFLPILILALLAFCPKGNYIKTKKIQNIIIPLLSACINSLFIINIISFFI